MIKAVIFDLDGVIVSTDEFHYRAWKKIADDEKIYFNHEINNKLRGISRMQSLEIILEQANKNYSMKDKKSLAERKNTIYRELLGELNPDFILAGVIKLIEGLKEKGIRLGLASSSKNTPLILKKIGMADCFDTVTDGNDIRKSKPDPEIFLMTAQKLNSSSEDCLVIEDAIAGIEAANSAGMISLAVGAAKESVLADLSVESLSEITAEFIVNLKVKNDN